MYYVPTFAYTLANKHKQHGALITLQFYLKKKRKKARKRTLRKAVRALVSTNEDTMCIILVERKVNCAGLGLNAPS